VTLTVRGLSLHGGERVLASDLGFTLAPGQTLLVRGPSGTGKTRLLRALAGLDPVHGELLLDDRPPASWGWPAWRAAVTYVPQLVPVLPGTPADLARRIGRMTGKEADLRPFAAQWGLPEAALDQPWTSLSGGEAQRALLALVLARDPAVLLLDEPTSALDATATRAVEGALAPRTKVWVTHDEPQAERLLSAGAQVLDLGPEEA